MAHRDHDLITAPFLVREFDRTAIELAGRDFGCQYRRQVRRSQERHRDHLGAVAIDDERFDGVRAFAVARHCGDDVDIQRAAQFLGSTQARRRIVVARDHHDANGWQSTTQLGEEAEPLLLCRGWRGRGIENIASDQYQLDGLRDGGIDKPRQERAMLLAAVDFTAQRLAQVPVRRVQQPHERQSNMLAVLPCRA